MAISVILVIQITFSCKCEYAISIGRYNLVCSGPTIINNNESDIWVINPGLTTSK